MRIFLHLGLRSTGGIDISSILHTNRERLLDDGVIFPSTGYAGPETQLGDDAGHAALANAINSPTIVSRENYYRKALIHELLTTGAETAIISSDALLDPVKGLLPSRVHSVLQSVGTVHPLVYLQRQDIYADALYRRMLCAPNRRIGQGFDRFVRHFLGRQWLDYASRIRPWVEEFGSENVIVRSFDDVVAHAPLVADLLALCSNIDAAGLKVPEEDTTAALDRSLTNLARAVDGFDNQRPRSKSAAIRELIHDAHWNSAREDTGNAAETLVDDSLWNDLRDEYSSLNDEIIETFLSGPSRRLRFESIRPPVAVVQQRFTMDEARDLASRRWPELVAAPRTQSLQGLIDAAFKPGWSAHGAARPRIGVCALIKAPPEQIISWINFHLNAGFDHIALFIDGPPFFDELHAIDNVTLVNCDVEFWQNMLVIAPQILDQKLRPIRQLGHEMLVAKGMDWTAGIDGDELLCGAIHKALSQLPPSVDSVRVAPAEAIQHANMAAIDGFESRVFKLKPDGDYRLVRSARVAYENISDMSLFGFFGHTQGKSIVRATVVADVWGSHNVLNTQRHVETVPLGEATLLHFESRPFNEWRERWKHKLDTDNQFSFFSQNRYNQYRRLEAAFQGDDAALKELYNRWYFMDEDRIETLEAEGLIERVRIPDAAFRSPGTS